ncbi:cystathionine beta-lyase [Geopsychrobacter electrodiphilus]|uniref:cystathionine beta-lyase n=1 Tax=Geopsychrobacter electrodiphilus TaxID=225196 RepID=UPI00036B1847|nr:cystathionine beta-lyase [Geopsychrobacter electrodiphilus]
MKGKSTQIIASGYSGKSTSLERYHSINPPIYHASTVLFDDYAELKAVGQGQYDGFTYGTDGSPTQRAFEQAITELEGGYWTKAFPSGLLAITSVLQAFLQSGDHLLVCNSVYGPVRRFAKNLLEKFGVTTSYFPANAGADIANYIRPETRLILLESPGSNTFEIQDVPAIVKLAREHGILTAIDNTWATPLFFSPFRHGVDISIHSVTKYISGHSDVLLGSATVSEACYATFHKLCRSLEIFASQDACYLALRGLKTLTIRLKQHEASALALATWLEAQPAVDAVLHPALLSHPEHAIWQRDFDGSAGIFSFVLKPQYAEEALSRFVDSLELFAIGYSWGGFKSLVTAGKFAQSESSRYHDRWMVRLNVGLEDVTDLQEDVRRALAKL